MLFFLLVFLISSWSVESTRGNGLVTVFRIHSVLMMTPNCPISSAVFFFSGDFSLNPWAHSERHVAHRRRRQHFLRTEDTVNPLSNCCDWFCPADTDSIFGLAMKYSVALVVFGLDLFYLLTMSFCYNLRRTNPKICTKFTRKRINTLS